jgi:hypothetical protein
MSHLGGYVPGGDPDTFAPEVWEQLVRLYNPKTMLDIGAGEGFAAHWFDTRGVRAIAIEGEKAASKVCIGKRLRTIVHDYTLGPILNLPEFDLGWCCEFVEHVEEKYADNFLSTFSRCQTIAMTHALPGQQGYHHVNCQPADYWVDKMFARGFMVNGLLSMQLREITTARWVKQTLMVFSKA